MKLSSITEMLENIAHQWRQPLSTISTAASGLKLKREMGCDKSDTNVDEALDVIVKSTMYLSKTIDNFTNYIKESEAKEILSLDEIIEKCLHIVNDSLDINSINLVYISDNIDDNITYKSELIQVIRNIINNAKDELIKLEAKRYIFIKTAKKQNRVLIEIKDNAGGIKPEIIDKIFEPYFTTKHKSIGTGLGLDIALKTVKSLDGNH